MANVEPLQRHVSAHIVGGGRAVGQLAGGLASSANVPVGESLRTAVDLAFDATRQLRESALDEQLAALVVVEREVTLIRAERICRADLNLLMVLLYYFIMEC